MRCRALLQVMLLVSMFPAAAAESAAAAAPNLTAATNVAGSALRPVGGKAGRSTPAPVAAAEEAQPLRPWLLALTGIVLVGMMASRRL